jgi:hypothetical protein
MNHSDYMKMPMDDLRAMCSARGLREVHGAGREDENGWGVGPRWTASLGVPSACHIIRCPFLPLRGPWTRCEAAMA